MRSSRRHSATRGFSRVSNGSLREEGLRFIEQVNSQLPTSNSQGDRLGPARAHYPGSWQLENWDLMSSEPQMHRETRRPSPEINLVPEEIVFEQPLALRLLIPQFAANHEHVADRDTNAAENDRAGRPPVLHEPAGEREPVIVDELADLAVAPVERADAGPHVRRDPGPANRQEPDGPGQRHDPKLLFLCDLAPIVPDLLCVDARDGVLIEARTDAGLEVVVESNHPFPAERRAVELVEIECQGQLALRQVG